MEDDIKIELPIQDWLLVMGTLTVMHKFEKYNYRLDNLIQRMNYHIVNGMKEDKNSESGKGVKQT